MPREKIEEKTTQEAAEPTCPLFGQYDGDDDSCKICDVAQECKGESDAMAEELGETEDESTVSAEEEEEEAKEEEKEEEAKEEEEEEEETAEEEEEDSPPAPDPTPTTPKKRGRKPGSKNKPKDTEDTPDPVKDTDDAPDPVKDTPVVKAKKGERLPITVPKMDLTISKKNLDILNELVNTGLVVLMLLHESLKSE